MGYPECVLTRNRKGETEVRRLLGRGAFVKYDYIYSETGKQAENGKTSIILKTQKRPTANAKQGLPGEQGSPITNISNQSGEEHYFLIPIKGGRFLAIRERGSKPSRRFWDPARGKAVGLTDMRI